MFTSIPPRFFLNFHQIFKTIRQAFRPQACEILTDVLQILLPRFFVPLNIRVTLVTLYQGLPTPGDSTLAVSPRCPRGVLAAECRVARPPVGDLFSHLGRCGHHGSPLRPHADPIGLHLGPICAPLRSSGANQGSLGAPI